MKLVAKSGLIDLAVSDSDPQTADEFLRMVAGVKNPVILAEELIAKPSFAIPNLLLRRILKRNAAQMIEQLRTEIVVRGTRNLELKTKN